jgi:hypothetical protein
LDGEGVPRHELVNFTACDKADAGPPLQLTGIRRHWPSPPERVYLWAEIVNPDEQEFSWSVRMFRGARLVYESGEELVLTRDRHADVVVELSLGQAEAKSYTIEFLLNGVRARKLVLDFGFTEAQP